MILTNTRLSSIESQPKEVVVVVVVFVVGSIVGNRTLSLMFGQSPVNKE